MESTAHKFLNALKKMIEEGRPAWQELQRLCDDEDINISEAIAWLEDIDGSVQI
jgi:hypothetical protein